MATMPVGNLIGGKLATDLPLPVQSPQIAPNLVDPIRSDGLLAQSAVASPMTGTTNETTLTTIAVPAGAMGVNGGVRISGLFSYTNSANGKALRVRFGGTAYYGPTVTTTNSAAFLFEIWNRGTANSQIGPAVTNTVPLGAAAVAPTTSTVDTSATFNITITGQLANSGETITLEAYTVEVLNP